MDEFCCCGELLRVSVYALVDGVQLKSCPNCSGGLGVHAFHPMGEFRHRHMNHIRHIQSWCTNCRHDRMAAKPVARCPGVRAQLPLFPRLFGD